VSRSLDWEHLKTLLALARGGTLSGAARSLGIDQSTVARRLAAMEERLGVRLIDRSGDGTPLTAAGQTALAAARAMEAEALSVERQLAGQDTSPVGTVRLTTLEMITSRVLAPALTDLATQHPGLVLEIIVDNRTLDLTRRDADLSLRLGRPSEGGLKGKRMATLAYGLYGAANRDWNWSGHPGLAGRPLILPDSSIGMTPDARWLAEAGQDGQVVARLASLNGQITACRDGLGLTCLPDSFAQGEPGLQRLADTGVTRELWLVLHPDLAEAARVRTIADWLTRICSSLS
jgi:DNA-binding transcriptional LysR family regulator